MKRFTMADGTRGEMAKRNMSAKAQLAIDGTDPCGIFADEDGMIYVTGGIELAGTFEEVEKDLEAIADEMGENVMRFQFEAGDGVNILWAEDEDRKIVAEVDIVPGCSEDYGYLTMKAAIKRKFPAETFRFWYDGQEDHLAKDASAGTARVEIIY